MFLCSSISFPGSFVLPQNAWHRSQNKVSVAVVLLSGCHHDIHPDPHGFRGRRYHAEEAFEGLQTKRQFGVWTLGGGKIIVLLHIVTLNSVYQFAALNVTPKARSHQCGHVA